uniref:AP2/ERF domain-containing protein n=1 Tax=Leersia perrieri TaxID=77586 RepID=A0A0D9X8J8_9ORYZ
MDQDGISGGAAPPQSSPERRYKGVRLRKWGRWVSEIRMPNSRERIWLGSYESAEKAARAFDAAAVCLRGSGGAVSLNFPDSPPDIRCCFPGALLTIEQIQAEAARHANRLYTPAAASTTNTAAVAVSPSYSSQQELAFPARSTSDDTAVSLPFTDGGVADYGGGDDDVIDWSFMDALPAMSAPSLPAGNINAEIVPAIDDFMYGFLHPMRQNEDDVEDVIDGNGDQAFFSVDLWRF